MEKNKDKLANDWADWVLKRVASNGNRGANKFWIMQALQGYHEAKICEQHGDTAEP